MPGATVQVSAGWSLPEPRGARVATSRSWWLWRPRGCGMAPCREDAVRLPVSRPLVSSTGPFRLFLLFITSENVS